MKKLFIVCSLVVALIGFMTFNAAADQITGAISFSGTTVPNDVDLSIATAFSSFTGPVVSTTGGTGNYAPAVANTPVTFTPFQFDPALSPNTVSPLWTFAIGGITYSFDATEVTAISRLESSISMEGLGIARITHFEDTPGTWSLSANTAGNTASFSASTVSVAAVPEPGTLMLLGLGLLGIGTSARIKIKK